MSSGSGNSSTAEMMRVSVMGIRKWAQMGESGNSLIASCSLAPGPRKRSPLLFELGSVPVPESSCRSARSGHSVRLVGFSSPPFRFGAPLISPHLLRPFISQLQPRPQQPPGHPIRGESSSIVVVFLGENTHRAFENRFIFRLSIRRWTTNLHLFSRLIGIGIPSSAPFSVRQMLLYNCVIP